MRPLPVGGLGAALHRYVEQRASGKDIFDLSIAVRKTAREGQIQAVMYEELRSSDPGYRYGYVVFFERQLFGLRLRQVGMGSWEQGELYRSGSWGGGRCEVEIYGDNRNGRLSGYAMADAPEVCQENLEADYILDLYILDGKDHLPRELQQIETGRN